MNDYRTRFAEKLKEALTAVFPIIGIVLVLSFTIAPVPSSILLLFIFGSFLLIIGMMFFTLGAELAMSPIGERVGTKMASTRKLPSFMFSSWFYHYNFRTRSSGSCGADPFYPQYDADSVRRLRGGNIPGCRYAPYAVFKSTGASFNFVLYFCIYTFRLCTEKFSGGSL